VSIRHDPRRTPAQAVRGFSLIEVLIAVTILAMISTLIMTSFSSLQSSKQGVRRVSERYRQGRMALSRMSRELQSAYLSHHLPLDQSLAVVRTAFIGQPDTPADRVDFNAFVNRRLDRDARVSDQLELSYYGVANPHVEGVYDLVRRFNPRLDLEAERGGRLQVLAEDIDLFDLEYLDPLTGLWTEEWDSREAVRQLDRIPLQVKITLVLNGGTRAPDAAERGTLTFATKVGLPIQLPLTFALK
jgi:general secretion pathway protein J